jgi:hypothetical protein
MKYADSICAIDTDGIKITKELDSIEIGEKNRRDEKRR